MVIDDKLIVKKLNKLFFWFKLSQETYTFKLFFFKNFEYELLIFYVTHNIILLFDIFFI